MNWEKLIEVITIVTFSQVFMFAIQSTGLEAIKIICVTLIPSMIIHAIKKVSE